MTEPGRYPAIYRARLSKIITSVLAVSAFILLTLAGRAHVDTASSAGIWVLASVSLAVVILSRLGESSSRIILHADRIEKKTWFGTKTWRRDDVAGLWFNKSDDFRLVRKNNKGDYFIVPAGVKYDSNWKDWLNGVPEFGRYDASARERRAAVGVIYVGFGTLALLMASLSFLNFRDFLIIERGVSVKGKISTVQNSKVTTSGWVDYRLPNGTECHDWMELAPNGSVRPRDDIVVAVNRTCGHSVSTKKSLHPWFLSVDSLRHHNCDAISAS